VRLWAIFALAVAACGVVRPSQAAGCPAPDEFVIAAGRLPATEAAIRRGNLTILALGGAATLGAPARGTEFTYPSRLAARLGDALPGVGIKLVVNAVPRQPIADLRLKLDADLAASKPALVIWGPGASAAGRGEDLGTFDDNITGVIARIQSSGADLILMTLQYAPSVARIVNLYPYRMAVMRGAERAGVPVLDRYELMRFWSDTNFLNLDATGTAERVRVARTLYDCMAEILTKGITGAVK